MATRRAVLALLAIVFIAGASVPAAAAPRRHGVPRVTIAAEGQGTLIVVRFGSGAASHLHLLHAREALDRVALADIDNDGDLDILAAPHDGALMLWHNFGHGHFARATLPHGARRATAQGPRFTHVEKMDDGWQWGDDRHDAALPRAPALVAALPVTAVRVTTPLYVRPASFRRFSSRAPPVL